MSKIFDLRELTFLHYILLIGWPFEIPLQECTVIHLTNPLWLGSWVTSKCLLRRACKATSLTHPFIAEALCDPDHLIFEMAEP